MSVTIYEIAKCAGVSSSTVARVLRGDIKGSNRNTAARVEKIQRLAKEMGYRRNWRARAFSHCKTNAVGLFHTHTAWICESPMGEIAGGFTDTMHDLGYHVVVVPYDEKGDWREILRDGRLDGIAVSHCLPRDAIDIISEIGLPRVLLMDKTVPNWPCVVTDDEMGAYTATRHLIDLGHRHIALFKHDGIREHYSIEERRSGYLRAMTDAQLDDDSSLWHVPESQLTSVLADRASRPSALLCYCHEEAMAVYLTAWQLGVKIPRDLSVVAFNDLQSSRYMTPPLTTMGFGTKHIGNLGASLLVRQIESEKPEVERIFLSQTLIQRNSAVPPMAMPNRRGEP